MIYKYRLFNVTIFLIIIVTFAMNVSAQDSYKYNPHKLDKSLGGLNPPIMDDAYDFLPGVNTNWASDVPAFMYSSRRDVRDVSNFYSTEFTNKYWISHGERSGSSRVFSTGEYTYFIHKCWSKGNSNIVVIISQRDNNESSQIAIASLSFSDYCTRTTWK